MNFKLIMLPNPILVSDLRISVGDSYHTSDYRIVKWLQELEDFSEGASSYPKPIIAGIEGLPSLDLSAIAEKIGWVDVENKVKELMGLPNYLRIESMSSSMQSSFEFGVECFKAAQSLNEKKYSLEDMMLCWDSAQSWREDKNTWEKFIQSLSYPKEYNVELEMEDKIALDGHTVIGKEPKITNNTITVTKIIKQL